MATAPHPDGTDDSLAEGREPFSASSLATIVDHVDAIIYVCDVDTRRLLFVNAYTRRLFGEVVGQICWKALQRGQTGPCDFCTNPRLMNPDGTPGDAYAWEFQNTLNRRWYDIRDRIIRWHDGRLVRLEVAIDITDRKRAEEEARSLQSQLGKATRRIRSLEGALPMCAWCKRVRDRDGEWHTIESLLESSCEGEVSHGMCPRCARDVE